MRLDSDHCLYIRNQGGIIIILFIYVDDLYIAASDKERLNHFLEYLKGHFKLKILGIPRQLLGITLTWGENFSSVHLNAAKHVNKLLESYQGQYKSRNVPIDYREKFLLEDTLKETKDHRLTKEEKAMQKEYASIAGSLIFLVTTCRPDIAYATQILCRSMSCPGFKHWDAAMYCLGYLSTTVELGIEYRSDGNMRPYGYCDADFGADESRKTTSGYMFFLAGGPFSWKSKLLKVVPLSTAESEVHGVDMALPAIRECCWIIKVLEEIGSDILGVEPFDEIKLHTPKDCEGLIVFEDNQACIQYAKNPVHHSTMKHLDRALKWIQQEHSKQTFKLVYVETVNQLADIFTKALEALTFWSLANRFMGYPP
jgi:hypothetical protein